ncbi:uncharacterized protein LOC135098913 isoform X1 [Scylla paramamosain]|uniref:uncharacterized protein LOC135098913 isoform X1 n=1 Tax=Scylla paramamosain TaxID=85552 RepID=UPI003083527E
MSSSRDRRLGSEESFEVWKAMASSGAVWGVRGRGEASCRVLLLLLLLACITGSVEGQCDGSPLYLGPRNSSLNVAFPEVNWDAHSNTWRPYQYYPTSVRCTWVVRAPAAHVLTAAFLHFDTEKDYDFVTIYSSEARTQQLLRESGDLTGEWFITSPEDTLVIDFLSDDYTTYYGFILAYRYEPRACVEGGVTVTEDQLIALPTLNLRGVLPGPRPDKDEDKPQKLQLEVPKGGASWQVRDGGSWVARIQYPLWMNCTWRVAVSPRQVVELDILRFSTAERDLLTVWEVGARGPRPLMSHGGTELPPRRTFRSSWPLLITFNTHSGEGGQGFLLDLTYITRACEPQRQELGAPRGLVAYPKYNLLPGSKGKHGAPGWRKDGQEEDDADGRAVYYGPDSCRWVLRSPPGYNLQVTVMHLDTRPQDLIRVVEGDELVMALSGGLPAKRNFVSQGSEITLKFDPLEDTTRTGFLLQYSWLLVECGGEVLVHGSGQVKSPYYPDTYGSNVTCQWKLTPPPGHLLHLLVTRLKLDAGDALQVKDGEKDLKIARDPDSSTGRLFELRPDPSVNLFFSSDSQHNEGYFLIKYAAFTLGSCDFGLSPCGWTASDPLQAWAFHPTQGMMVVAEESTAGLQLPRGYRAILTSPWVTPITDMGHGEPEDVCLSFDYLLDGPDAFLLSAWLVQEGEGRGAMPRFTPLAFLHGPHGNRSLTAAVNFTVSSSASFRVVMQYERGYGREYRAGVGGVWVGRGRQCGRELDHLRATSCNFTRDLCGWTNTHTDHTNWQLTDQGVEAVELGGSDDGGQRWADLISPLVARGDLRKREEQAETQKARENMEEEEEGEGGAACFNLLYRVLSGNAELRVVLRLKGDGEEAHQTPGSKENQEGEQVLWSQGRVESPGVLRALVNLPQVLPSQYQLVLRAVGVGGSSGGGGVAVRAARLEAGRCSGGASCSFDSGFCSWKVSYTGGTVWYIRQHEAEEEGSHAAVLVGGTPGGLHLFDQRDGVLLSAASILLLQVPPHGN